MNRYVGLGGAALGRLASLIEGWPLQPLHDAADVGDTAIRALVEPLVARGWLIDDSKHGSADNLPSVRLPQAARTVDEDSDTHPTAAGAMRTLRFFESAMSAAWGLRRRSLLANAQRVAERRLRLQSADDAHGHIVTVVSDYLRLRPLLFTARDRCLHDSLTLVTFLAGERISAHWVIGVRISPFAAHSWVQHDDVVLNDQHERVRAYRPILVV